MDCWETILTLSVLFIGTSVIGIGAGIVIGELIWWLYLRLRGE